MATIPPGSGSGTQEWHFSDGTVLYIDDHRNNSPNPIDPVLYDCGQGPLYSNDPHRCPYRLKPAPLATSK